jgi:predicted transcriptional regulator
MKTLNQNAFDDFENKQLIWEIYAELLDFYDQNSFCAKSVAYSTNTDVKLINKILHRLIYYKAVECVGTDTWGAKKYKLNKAFKGY